MRGRIFRNELNDGPAFLKTLSFYREGLLFVGT